MSDPAFRMSLLQPRVTPLSGLRAGLQFGPFVAFLVIFFPSNAWLGPFPAYWPEAFSLACVAGFIFAPAVGMAIALLARLAQEIAAFCASGENRAEGTVQTSVD
jgi:hypothetical protein